MPFVAIPLTCKLELNGVCDSQQVVNVLHYKFVGAQTGATLGTFITNWLSAHKTQWLAVHGTNYRLDNIVCTDISSPSGASVTTAVPGPTNVGTIAGSPLPNNVALAVSWRTGLAGRRNRGRSFIGGLTANAASADLAASTFVTDLATLATSLISTSFAGGFDFGVTSKLDVATKIITGFVIEAILDSMRRRLPTRGS